MPKLFTITEGLENLGALHTGGQGSVYKALRKGEYITAVKILPTPIFSENTEDKNFADFQNEVAKLKKVSEQPCPNVVRILGSGITETGSFPYIEMEFIEGPELEELLKPPHERIFTIAEAIKVAEHLSQALAHCHSSGVQHADVKSNNVKYNLFTGHYVLLDFGLSIMSDEQRRTSLRRAGAVEFMAPEQHHGQFLFASDVYSFGVILYELLAGQVPFPLSDRSEAARNKVVLAHLEESIPDLLALRKVKMPEKWSEETAAAEMLVPQWLLQLIEKCLQKTPAHRYANGMLLKEAIRQQVGQKHNNSANDEALMRLREENKKLAQEKSRLQQALEKKEGRPIPKKSGLLLPLLFLLGGIALGYAGISMLKGKETKVQVPVENTTGAVKPRNSIGQFMVVAARAYFHAQPDEATRRKAFMIPSSNVVSAWEERNGFIYTEFTNSKGQTSKGWLKKMDLMTLDEWTKRNNESQTVVRLRPEDVAAQMDEAKNLMAKAKIKEAVFIYAYLAKQSVPEAMYLYGNLALQKKHAELSCTEALAWVTKAADRNYVPAKRTLGFLYIFADNQQLLEMNEYGGCPYRRNVYKGTKLLSEAVAAGDSTAAKMLRQLNLPGTESSR